MSEMTEVVRARDLHAGDAVLVGHDLFEIVERRYTRGGHVWITTEGHHYPFCVPITERMRVRAFEPASGRCLLSLRRSARHSGCGYEQLPTREDVAYVIHLHAVGIADLGRGSLQFDSHAAADALIERGWVRVPASKET